AQQMLLPAGAGEEQFRHHCAVMPARQRYQSAAGQYPQHRQQLQGLIFSTLLEADLQRGWKLQITAGRMKEGRIDGLQNASLLRLLTGRLRRRLIDFSVECVRPLLHLTPEELVVTEGLAQGLATVQLHEAQEVPLRQPDMQRREIQTGDILDDPT